MVSESSSRRLDPVLFRLALRSGRLPGVLGKWGRHLGRTRGMLTSCGYRMVVHDPREYIQRCVFTYGSYEPGLTTILSTILRPGDVYFDVGANIGNHSLVAASRGASVHAFEPIPRLAGRLRENFEFNNIESRLTLTTAAVGAQSGIATLYEAVGLDDGSHSLIPGVPAEAVRELRVEVVTLDDYAASKRCHPAVIKIDVEGYEAVVLEGSSRLLTSNPPPFVLIETADRLANQIGESAGKVLGRLEEKGYQLFRLDELSAVLEPVTAAVAGSELANYLGAHPANPRTAIAIDALGSFQQRTGT